mmetsp:Transcript_637/g.817  ORF Transcript_637/g.817 Transcript_637/m.817 type:complete len:281 (+) Transcript_637:62-904(+)
MGVGSTIGWILAAFATLYFCWTLFASYVMYAQEKKAYKNVSIFRVFMFSLMWIYGSFVCIILTIPTMIKERSTTNLTVRNKALFRGQQLGHCMFDSLFGNAEVLGKENVPVDDDTPVVYVTNHQSMIDIALLYFVDRRFAWVSKSAAFSLPGVGSLMKVSQFIRLKRGNRASVEKMFDGCKHSMATNCSVAIFPQGTRKRLEWLPFKDGAFHLAANNGYTIVPVSIFLPEDIWSNPKKTCRLTIHKPLPVLKDKDELKRLAYEAVVSAVPYADKVQGKKD